MDRTEQTIRGQTIDKTMAKPIGVVKNQEKAIIWNKTRYSTFMFMHEWVKSS